MKTTKIIATFKGLVLVGAILSSSVVAADATLYKKCAGCHGQQAEKKAMGKSKIINSMTAAEIVGALNGYKDGSYGGSMKGLMKGQVKSLDDEQIESLAQTISEMK